MIFKRVFTEVTLRCQGPQYVAYEFPSRKGFVLRLLLLHVFSVRIRRCSLLYAPREWINPYNLRKFKKIDHRTPVCSVTWRRSEEASDGSHVLYIQNCCWRHPTDSRG